MKKMNMAAWIVAAILLGLLAGCGDSAKTEPSPTVSAAFESGSIGKATKVSDTEWELHIANDNGNAALPATWRCWWYVRLDNPVRDLPTKITVKNSGWPYYYLPIYSYDQVTWHHFSEDEVTQTPDKEIVVTKRFDNAAVWIARFYPYTFTDLEKFLDTIKGSQYVDLQTPGSSQNGKPIYLIKITDSTVPVSGKKRIFLHARTHSAETPSSFLVEGVIQYLLSGSQGAKDMLARFEFYIFPMQNVDGAMAGNYRSTPKSENLEMSWVFDVNNPLDLIGEIPPEVAIVHSQAKKLMTDGGPPVSIALNLHASNSEPDIRPFFFPHFGADPLKYLPLETSLWEMQLRFIDKTALHFGAEMIEPDPTDGGRSFASKTYPESWWWANYKDQVMAMTMEMTYGRSGYAPRWIKPDDMRHLGTRLALSIRDYSLDTSGTSAKTARRLTDSISNRVLKYPELYPPRAEDELKR